MRRYNLPHKATTAEAVILADGEYPAGESVARAILDSAGYVVCCDGAADKFIALGGRPAAIVGDGDSMSTEIRERYADIVHCTTEQESNDLTKAFHYCLSQGKKSVIILGATGRREDHTIGNISLLSDYAREADVCMITNSGVFDAIEEPSLFNSFTGQQVSIVTIATTTRITVDNLLYTPPADGLCAWWRGTLNESLEDEFTIGTDGTTIIFRVF